MTCWPKREKHKASKQNHVIDLDELVKEKADAVQIDGRMKMTENYPHSVRAPYSWIKTAVPAKQG